MTPFDDAQDAQITNSKKSSPSNSSINGLNAMLKTHSQDGTHDTKTNSDNI